MTKTILRLRKIKGYLSTLSRRSLVMIGICFTALCGTAILFTNASNPTLSLSSLSTAQVQQSAQSLQTEINSGKYSANGVMLLQSYKVAVDNYLARRVLAKTCADLIAADPTLTQGIYNLYPDGKRPTECLRRARVCRAHAAFKMERAHRRTTGVSMPIARAWPLRATPATAFPQARACRIQNRVQSPMARACRP